MGFLMFIGFKCIKWGGNNVKFNCKFKIIIIILELIKWCMVIYGVSGVYY